MLYSDGFFSPFTVRLKCRTGMAAFGVRVKQKAAVA
jgi:hypothetical protein